MDIEKLAHGRIEIDISAFNMLCKFNNCPMNVGYTNSFYIYYVPITSLYAAQISYYLKVNNDWYIKMSFKESIELCERLFKIEKLKKLM